MHVTHPKNRRPADYAKAFHRQGIVDSLPVDVYRLARKLGVRVIKEPYETEDFDGCLIKTRENPKIIVNSNIRYRHRQTFTVAHELGHFVIPSHSKAFFECYSADWAVPSLTEEVEANEFASELLMPYDDVVEYLKFLPPSLHEFENLADRYGVSFTAAAYKFVSLTAQACAILFSRQGTLEKFAQSRSFRFRLLKEGLAPSSESLTIVQGSRWLANPVSDISLVEESRPFTNLGLIFSLIYLLDTEQEPYDYGYY